MTRGPKRTGTAGPRRRSGTPAVTRNARRKPDPSKGSGDAPAKVDNERQCVACRRRAPANRLVRLAVGPRFRLVADPFRRLPGRGAHVCARPECLRAAVEKGNLARAFKEPVVGDPAELAEQAAGGLEDKAWQMLGLARRSGILRLGHDEVVRGVTTGQVALVVVAPDASARTRDDVATPAQMRGIPVREGPPVARMGPLLGRGEVAVVALAPGSMAEDYAWLVDAAATLRGSGARAGGTPVVETPHAGA